MHILIVEDTQAIGSAMQEYLTACGYKVTRVTTLQETYNILHKHQVDCVVLDWMLPDGDGVQACCEIKSYKNIPVIMETAKGQIEDKIQWFDCGADDYLTKPFDLKELELRIKAVTKRSDVGDLVYRKNISIDLEKNQAFKDGTLVSLTNKEFLIVALLISNNGKTISRTELLEEIWGDEGMRGNDNKLDVHISTIRKKLDKDFIQTIKGMGYRIGM